MGRLIRFFGDQKSARKVCGGVMDRLIDTLVILIVIIAGAMIMWAALVR